MIAVIQVFKSVKSIQKPDYSTDTRQLLGQWEDSIVSKTGFLADNTLILPSNTKLEADLKTAKLIIIQDIKGFEPILAEKHSDKAILPYWFTDNRKKRFLSTNQQLICFNQLTQLKSFEIFKIGPNTSDSFDLHVNYSANEFYIGLPKRDDHKIAELTPNKPIRYKTNGKSDFTLTGRKQRTFVEYDYIFEYLGMAEKIVFKDLNKIENIKWIPTDRCKLVDERKLIQ